MLIALVIGYFIRRRKLAAVKLTQPVKTLSK